MESEHPQPLILFDGECKFCNHWVQFILKHDTKNQFYFAKLQSPFGKKILQQYSFEEHYLESTVLIEKQKIYIASTSGLLILKKLGGFWQVFGIFMLLPKSIRDGFYNFIGKNKWFGKTKTCIVPPPHKLAKFIT